MKRLGILGGNQVAQMTVQAAISFGIDTAILERFADSPASRLTQYSVIGDWTDAAALGEFAKMCDVITLENEFVDAWGLALLEGRGLSVYPSSETLTLTQDKFWQKNRLEAEHISLPAFRAVETPDDVIAVGEAFGWPLVLKARRDGHDGYGNVILQKPTDIHAAWTQLVRRNGRKLMVEQFISFAAELAVIVVRGRDGIICTYPVVETIQRDHICHIVRAPAQISSDIAQRAAAIARTAVEAVNGVGVFGVELFLLHDGTLLFNEMAPRPHNAGHFTIEGCVTSQFENHIRAVMGWPLGATEMIAPAAVMVNLLGTREGIVHPESVHHALSVPAAHIHFYGKRVVDFGRKMGHVTVLGATLEEAETVALHAANWVDL